MAITETSPMIWVRAETPSIPPRGVDHNSIPRIDSRTPLSPADAAHLIQCGCQVFIEESSYRAFSDDEYRSAGCRVVASNTWSSAPRSALILGIRKPMQFQLAFPHSHLFFAHAYKSQKNWENTLAPFLRGKGMLYDYEYFVDTTHKRIVSFGRTAGHIAMISALYAWCHQTLKSQNFSFQRLPMVHESHRLEALLEIATQQSHRPRVCIVGAHGRVGRGAVSCARQFDLELDQWTRKHTKESNGPFPELLQYDIVINAMRLPSRSVVLLDHETVRQEPRRLSLIVDVACEHEQGAIPLYKKCTTFENPTMCIVPQRGPHRPLDLLAIPNLPSLLPRLSCEDFSFQLLPHLLDFVKNRIHSPVFQRAKSYFDQACTRLIPPIPHYIGEQVVPYDATRQHQPVVIEQIHLKEFDETMTLPMSTVCKLTIRTEEIKGFALRCLASLTETCHLYMEYFPLSKILCLAAKASFCDANSLQLYAAQLQNQCEISSWLDYFSYSKWYRSLNNSLVDQARMYWKTIAQENRNLTQISTTFDYDSAAVDTLRERVVGPEPFYCETDSMPLSCLIWVISRLSGNRQILIKSIPSKRPFEFSTTCFGPLTNSGLFGIDCDPELSLEAFTTLVEDTKRTMDHHLAWGAPVVVNDPQCQTLLSQMEISIEQRTISSRLQLVETLQSHNCTYLHFTLWTIEIENRVFLSCDYSPELYSRESIQEILRQCRSIGQARPETKLGVCSLVTSFARQHLPDPSLPIVPVPWPGSIRDIAQSHAEHFPDRIAIYGQDGLPLLNYAQLIERSKQVGSYLYHKNSVQTGDIVSIIGYRCSALVLAILGCFYTGAAYAMIDPKYPKQRIDTLISLTRPKVVLIIKGAETSLDPQIDTTQFLTVTPAGIASREKYEIPEVGLTPNTIAVVTFTSGSTGTPKGVLGRHGPLTQFYPWMQQEWAWSACDRFGMCSGVAHDPLQRDIFTPLFLGASLCIPDEVQLRQPGYLARFLHDTHVSCVCLTPAMGQILTCTYPTNLEIEQEFGKQGLHKLRHLFFVGECLLKKDVQRVLALAPQVECVNMLGSTETQRSCSYVVVTKDTLQQYKQTIHVGKGMKGVDLILVNEQGLLAGVGERAEIYLRSRDLAQGYLRLIDLTKDRFLVNWFTEVVDETDRMYKTGDAGRYTIEGNVECCGRFDDQIQIRGYRVELGEINACLSKATHLIEECFTMACETPDKIVQVVCFVVSKETRQDMEREIKEYLHQRLPDYMMPASVLFVPCLPLTINGKIDRVTLEKWYEEYAEERLQHQEIVLNPSQQVIYRIWCRVLNISSFDPASDFFRDLGGHSLLATLLTCRLTQELQRDISHTLIYTRSTFVEYCRALEKREIATDSKSTQTDYYLKQVEMYLNQMDTRCLSEGVNNSKAISSSRTILVTGATGFLGTFLVARLLQRPHTKVICGVRGRDAAHAQERMEHSLNAHLGTWTCATDSSYDVIVMDLAQDDLGWNSTLRQSLGQQVDAILHNGALVHWLYSYQELANVNCQSTMRLLEFAQNYELEFHYVSTTSTLIGNEPECRRTPELLTTGYALSKWVAEQLVMKYAKLSKLPAFIYRPGFISGDTKRGVWNTDDFLVRLIKGCIELQYYPFPEFHYRATVDMCPVDYVAKVISTGVVATDRPTLFSTYNITSECVLDFHALFNQINAFGYQLTAVPYEIWRQMLLDQIQTKGAESNCLAPVVSEFTCDWIDQKCQKTEQINQSTLSLKVEFPCKTRKHWYKVIVTYLSYLVGCGYLPPPSTRSDNHLDLDWMAIREQVDLLSRTNRS